LPGPLPGSTGTRPVRAFDSGRPRTAAVRATGVVPGLTVCLVACLAACLALACGAARGADIPGHLHPDWSAVPYEPFPINGQGVPNPVLTAIDVTDVYAYFVADPFLMKVESTWYMFFEIHTTIDRRISLATSLDGLDWTYQGVVLGGGVNYSFPFVFQHQGRFYMVPESGADDDIEIFEATSFPYGWTPVATILSGRHYVDPVIVRYQGRWWLFAGISGSAACHLFYSDQLLSGWTEHPMSPIVPNNNAKARPAGRFVVFYPDRVIRLAQNASVPGRRSVRAFEVDAMTPTTYVEHEIPASPILGPSGSGWNELGMHHCDPWWVEDRWMAAVDGMDTDGMWSIGIEFSRQLASADWLPGSGGEEADRLQVFPNPFSNAASIRAPAASRDGGIARILICDADGRLVRRLAFTPGKAGDGVVHWDGKDEMGRDVGAGTYFLDADGDGGAFRGRLVRIR